MDLTHRARAPLEPPASAPPTAGPAPRGPAAAMWQSIATRPRCLPVPLALSTPGDASEQEAERIADAVAGPAPALPSEGSPARPGAFQEVLRQPGRPLDPATRAFFEPRFGQAFGDVRLHAGAQAEQAASSLHAHAFTLGAHVVLGTHQGAPDAPQSRRLLAHELAHVVQQRSGPSGAATIARQAWGTARTSAPPAQNRSPGDVFRETLRDEVALFANAAAILDWIVAERSGTGGATVTSVATAALFADPALMKKLKPVPASAVDLLPAMEMLSFYGVLKRGAPGTWDIVLAPLQPGQVQQDVDRARFDQNRKDIAAFRTAFETRFDAQGHPRKPIAQQSLLEDALAAGAASEFKAQHSAEDNLAAVLAELDEFVAFRKKGAPVFRVTSDSPATDASAGTARVLLPIAGKKAPLAVDQDNLDRIEPIRTGTSPEAALRRAAIEARIKTAQGALFAAQGFHRFAVEMVFFLHELDTRSSIRFAAGTYPAHGKFGEYAADLFPVIAENTAGFYEVGKAERFVDEINAVAEAGHPVWGKFAWQIVYNDTTLQATINARYGGRMSSAPHHGPAPDKLHMHLDIRPLNVVADPVTGFGVNPAGRVVLF